jgi:hypothetical protein
MYDVVTTDGRRLNEQPLGYSAAELFALDAMIDSELHANVVPSVRQEERQTRIPWLVLCVVAAAILGAVVVGCL